MGQKVNPIGLRLGVNRTWDSRWFASRGWTPRAHQTLASTGQPVRLTPTVLRIETACAAIATLIAIRP